MLREAFITWHAQYLMSGKIISIIFFLIAYDNKIENDWDTFFFVRNTVLISKNRFPSESWFYRVRPPPLPQPHTDFA